MLAERLLYGKPIGLLSRMRPVKSIFSSYHPLNVCQMVSTVCSEWSLIPGTLSLLCFTHAWKPELSCQVEQRSKALTPPQGLELTKVAFCLNTLSLSGVKNKACQSLTACREKDINYSRQRVERSCLE